MMEECKNIENEIVNVKYRENKTMEMMGRQYAMSLLDRSEVRKEYKDVYSALVKHDIYLDIASCTDIFMLGYIWGKRDERKRRKNNKK